ncbi:hypothetical protein D3C84_589220 [compost metagenome]
MNIGLVLRHEVIANAQHATDLGVAVGGEEPVPTCRAQRRVQAFLSLLGLLVVIPAQAGDQVQLGLFLQLPGDGRGIGRALGIAVSGVWRALFLQMLFCPIEHCYFAMMAERIAVFEQRADRRLA